MKINTLIVDDKLLARQRLVNLISDIPALQLVGQCSTGKEAISKINELKPKLIFLDIQLKDIDGFKVIQKITLEEKPIIVLVTAQKEHVLKAYDFFVFDFLLKPYKDSRFYNSVERIIETFNVKKQFELEKKLSDLLEKVELNNELFLKKSHKLPIKLGNKVFFVNFEDLNYITAAGSYIEIHTNEKKHILRESLSSIFQYLEQSSFSRIHRSTVINNSKVMELISSNYGEVDVKMIDNMQFRVSKSYKKDFLIAMQLKRDKSLTKLIEF